jgi:hypothetical protein
MDAAFANKPAFPETPPKMAGSSSIKKNKSPNGIFPKLSISGYQKHFHPIVSTFEMLYLL